MDNKQSFEEVADRIDELMAIMQAEIIPREIARLRTCNCKAHCKHAAAQWEKAASNTLSTVEMLDGIEVNQAWLDAAPPSEEEAHTGV